jgi:hypothetical protein
MVKSTPNLGFSEVSKMSSLLELIVWCLGEWTIARFLENRAKNPSKVHSVAKNRFEDPVYKRNVQYLIERHRKFESERER